MTEKDPYLNRAYNESWEWRVKWVLIELQNYSCIARRRSRFVNLLWARRDARTVISFQERHRRRRSEERRPHGSGVVTVPSRRALRRRQTSLLNRDVSIRSAEPWKSSCVLAERQKERQARTLPGCVTSLGWVVCVSIEFTKLYVLDKLVKLKLCINLQCVYVVVLEFWVFFIYLASL